MNHRKDYCLFYDPSHPCPRFFLDMNKTVEEVRLDNTNPWIRVTWTNNRFYANSIPIPCEDNSEASSKGKSNMSDSSDEADFPEYDSDSDGPHYLCTLTTRERKGSSKVPFTVDPGAPPTSNKPSLPIVITCQPTTLF